MERGVTAAGSAAVLQATVPFAFRGLALAASTEHNGAMMAAVASTEGR